MQVVYYTPIARNMIHINRSAGKIEEHPFVEIGIMRNSPMDGRVEIDLISVSPNRTIDGVPEKEFISTEWFKRQKRHGTAYNWTENAVKDHIQYLDPVLSDEELSVMRKDNPDDILRAIKAGYFVFAEDLQYRIQTEVSRDGKSYRIFKEHYHFPTDYAKAPPKISRPTKDCFSSYEAAMSHAKGICVEEIQRIREEVLIDRKEEIAWAISKVPENKREEAAFRLEFLPYDVGSSIRVYNGEILFRETTSIPWRVIFNFA